MDKIINKVIDDFNRSGKEYISCSRLYQIYTKRCNKQNIMPIANNWFGREVKKQLDRKQRHINREKVWVYLACKIETANMSPANNQQDIENKFWQGLRDSINDMEDLLEHIEFISPELHKRIKNALDNEQSW